MRGAWFRNGAVIGIPAGVMALALGASGVLQAAPAQPTFDKDIAPLLTARCVKCHGGSATLGNLDLRTLASARRGGAGGAAVIAGHPEQSPLLKRVADKSMPPGNEKKLTAAEVQLIRAWIATGEKPGSTQAAATAVDKTKHWSYQTVKRPEIPKVKNAAWVRTPIDSFILARLEKAGIAPPPSADKRTLLRRVTLDLIGLPPTPEEQDAFLNDPAPDAYERLVDRLLASKEYGERWARKWLDVARYAESNGYERDGGKPSAWRYRDYVINAFNADKPYDRFITEQLAGDEMPGSNAETQIATTFLRLGTWDDEPAEPMVDRYDQLDDIVGTTSAAFLGVTLRCARCHDHKFEPFSQKEYYSFLSVFQPLRRPQDDREDLDVPVGTSDELKAIADANARLDEQEAVVAAEQDRVERPIRERLFASGVSKLDDDEKAAFRVEPAKRTPQQRTEIKSSRKRLNEELSRIVTPEEKAALAAFEPRMKEIAAARPSPPRAYIWQEPGTNAPDTKILHRGDPFQPRDSVSPTVPAVMLHAPLAPPTPTAKTTGRRLWLAKWLTDPANPLTSRVMVNRIWQGHFGEGLVATENDFGVMGQAPTHPELLDWLASEFATPTPNAQRLTPNAWSIKSLHRQIVLSSTYRAVSTWDPAKAKRDVDDVLHWRFRPRRLEGEAIRDSILAASGQLNTAYGGPSVFPKIPRAVLEGQSRPGSGWETSNEHDASRRSIYVFAKRSLALPELEILDAPDNASSCEQRPVSTIAPQALTFLNGEFALQQAKYFAARLRKDAGESPKTQVERAFALTVSRPPTAAELKASLDFLTAQEKQIASDLKAAGKPEAPAGARALEAFALAMLNNNEFVYLP